MGGRMRSSSMVRRVWAWVALGGALVGCFNAAGEGSDFLSQWSTAACQGEATCPSGTVAAYAVAACPTASANALTSVVTVLAMGLDAGRVALDSVAGDRC